MRWRRPATVALALVIGLLVLAGGISALVLTAQRNDRLAYEQRVRDYITSVCGDVLEPRSPITNEVFTFDTNEQFATVTAKRRDGRTAVVHTEIDVNPFVGRQYYDEDCEGPADAPADDECVPTDGTSCRSVRRP